VDFDKVISAHAQWKMKFRAAINRKEQLNAQDIARDDLCELGKWIHSSGTAKYSHNGAFTQLVGEHKQFHRCAGEVAQTINQRNYDHAERLIGAESKFSEASNLVISTLGRMKRV
jgi:hypothetical protein